LERAGALAMHAVQGELAPAAHHWLLHAAERAKAVFAGAEAERFLAQAAEFATSAAEQRAVWERIGDLRRAQTRFGAAALAFHHALGHTESGSTARLGLRIKLLDASLRSGVLRLPDADAAIATLIEDAGEAGSAWLRDALRVAASAYLHAGDLARAEEHALRALDAARGAGDAAGLVRALLLRTQAGTLRRTLPDALPVLAEAVRVAAESGLLRELCDAQTEYATELCRQGRWTEAITEGRQSLRHGEAAGAVGAVAVARLNLADLLLRSGKWEEAGEHLENAWTLSERFDFPHVRVDVLVNRALLAWTRGDGAKVREPAQCALEQATAHGMVAAEQAARALLALTLIDEEATEEARRVLDASPEPQEQHHPTWSDDHELTVAARARLLAHQGDPASAAGLLTAALEEAAEPYATALLQLELAHILRDEDPAAALRHARNASTILARLGAQPLLLRAQKLLTDAADRCAPC
nr:hypothetical protein [Gemmatimonadota bacterium]